MINLDSRLRSAAFAAAPLGVVIVIALVILPLSPAYDLNVFLRAGEAILRGRDFYPRVGSPAVYSGSSFVYPALAVWPFVPLAALPAESATAIFFALCAFAVVAVTWLAADRDRWIAVIVMCTAFTITGLQLGALSPLLYVGAVCLWKLRDRPLLFGLVAAPVIVSKLFLAPLLLWPLMAKRYRALAWATSLTLSMLAIGFVSGPLGAPSYLRLLAQLGTHEAGAGFGLIGLLRNAGLTALAAQASALGLAALVSVRVYAHYRRVRDERVLYCAGIVCALLLTPVLWSHYLVLLLAVLLALDARRRWFVVLAIASWVMSPPHGLHLTLPVPEELKSPGPLLAVALLPLLLALAIRPRRRSIDSAPVYRERNT
jgi:alpha-1,2-mannosyltransferase